MAKPRLTLALLLTATFALRAWRADQPIVENYVGRQVPTAMVARNLERGSGFLRPALDTGPFPNLFLVEPPIFALAAVGLRRATGLPLEDAGRLVSALATTLGAWGIHGLARRRSGQGAALASVAAFGAFPVTIRYGRAFQPDMLMIGMQVAALRCWDDREAGAGRARLAVGWALLATSLALKITSAYVFLPLFALMRPRRPGKVALALAAIVPALLWYAHAADLLRHAGGSGASADNGAIWLRVLVPTALLRWPTYLMAGRSLLVRAFTPIGFALGVWGLLPVGHAIACHPPDEDKEARNSVPYGVVRIWAAAALAALAVLAGKLHHEYYWLLMAPPLALAAGRGLADLAARSRAAAGAAALAFLSLAVALSASTWRTPPEWSALPEAAGAVKEIVPVGEWLVAPEALLYFADRRGCRLEFERAAADRAAGEWGGVIGPEDPLALVEFYRSRGARFVADVGPEDDSRRRAWREAVRRRYIVRVDRPGTLLIAELEGPPDARR